MGNIKRIRNDSGCANSVMPADNGGDLVVTLTREIDKIAEDINSLQERSFELQKLGQNHWVEDATEKERQGELDAMMELVGWMNCKSAEGAICQLMHAASSAGVALDSTNSDEDLKKIRRLVTSALLYLADHLRLDLETLGSRYLFQKELICPPRL